MKHFLVISCFTLAAVMIGLATQQTGGDRIWDCALAGLNISNGILNSIGIVKDSEDDE